MRHVWARHQRDDLTTDQAVRGILLGTGSKA